MEILGIGSRVNHSTFGQGVVINLSNDAYEITFITEGTRKIKLDAELEVIEKTALSSDHVSLYDIEKSLNKILQRWLDATEIVPLGDKWKGGKMILEPGKTGVMSKEIPIETFFHKIVMMRDDEEAKVDIQQYISRCYGSMTTFNILFKEVEDQFKS
jgi:hypothetical protein